MIINFISDDTKTMEVNTLTKGSPYYTMLTGKIGIPSQNLSPYGTSLDICVHFSSLLIPFHHRCIMSHTRIRLVNCNH